VGRFPLLLGGGEEVFREVRERMGAVAEGGEDVVQGSRPQGSTSKVMKYNQITEAIKRGVSSRANIRGDASHRSRALLECFMRCH
jgi:hypothetical protein